MKEIDMDNSDVTDEIIRAIEKDYGRSVARIPYFHRSFDQSFDIKIVFTDFGLLEANIKVTLSEGIPTIEIQGVYY